MPLKPIRASVLQRSSKDSVDPIPHTDAITLCLSLVRGRAGAAPCGAAGACPTSGAAASGAAAIPARNSRLFMRALYNSPPPRFAIIAAARTTKSMPLASGARLGPYEITSALGAGGMGEVYKARDSRLGRDVALKILPATFASDGDRLQRFEQEARAAAALNHPNILAVHDVGQHDGSPYIVSELLEGETLRDRLNGGALPVRKAIECAIQIAHGLAAAHEKGITHRDLKPENLFVTSDGRVKILDFGLAKLTQIEAVTVGASVLPTTPPQTLPGVVLGTIGYMAPEQVRGQQADHRSDIFAYGTILYELLSGQRAFQGETAPETMTAILKGDPPDLPAAERHIPPALARIVDR